MVIAIDVRPLIGGHISGIETYINKLVGHLLAIDKKNTYILFLNSFRNETKIFERFRENNVYMVHTHYPNKIFNVLLSIFRWPKLDRIVFKRTGMEPDIFFIPDIRPSPVSSSVKKVCTVHDLAFKHFPYFFSWRTRLWYKLINPKREITESNSIIAVSNFTKLDIEKTYGIDPFYISVIHEGIENGFKKEENFKKLKNVRKKYQLPDNYFLFLSTLEPRKNISTLIHAFRIFRQKKSDIKLVIAGKRNEKLFSKLPGFSNENIIFTGFIQENDKAALFSMAKAFIYPSLYEGFGLPLLESMKCNTPIIASNVGSIPEVVGSAAILVDPYNPKEMANAMSKILKPNTRSTLKAKMASRIKNFSWDKCAAETLITFLLS